MPEALIYAIMALPSILSLFGGNKSEQTQTTTQTPAGPSDPGYGLLSPFALSAITQNLQRMSGAGMPQGTQALGGGMGADILKYLNRSWPDILKGYNRRGTPTSQSGYTYGRVPNAQSSDPAVASRPYPYAWRT